MQLTGVDGSALTSGAETRTDGIYIGQKIREIVRLMIEEAISWQKAADAVGLARRRAKKAIEKPHVVAYRREQRKAFLDLLCTRVPHRLNELMDSENAAAAVRATLALEELNQQSRAEPMRRISTGGIIIVLGGPQQKALSAGAASMPVIEQTPLETSHPMSDDPAAR
jgi:hypothetical protein